MLPSPSYRFGTYQPAPADSPSPFDLPSPDIPRSPAAPASSLARASTSLTPPGTGTGALGRSYSLPPPSLSASSSFPFFNAASSGGALSAHHPLARSGSLALSPSTAFRELGNGCLDLNISACGSTSGSLALYDTVESAAMDRRPSAASTCFSSSVSGLGGGGRRDSIWSSRASFDSAASSLVSPASEDKDRPSTGSSSVFAFSPFMVGKGDRDVKNMVETLTGGGSGEEDSFSFALDCSLAATKLQLSASSPAFQPAVTAASFPSCPNQLAASTAAEEYQQQQQQQQYYSSYQQQRPQLHRQQPFAPSPSLAHGFDAALHFAQLSLATSAPSHTYSQPSHFATPTLIPQTLHLPQQPTSLPLAPVPALALDPSYPLPPHTTAAIAALHNGRVPALSQLAPPSPPTSHSADGTRSGSPPLAPIVNTGNVGPMVVQQGDWCCGACGFTNWRRRVVCIKCFPHASPTIVRTGGASGAAPAAVTSPLAKKQRTSSLPVTPSFAPSVQSMQPQRFSVDAGQPRFNTAVSCGSKDDQRTANYQRKFPQRGNSNHNHGHSRLQLSQGYYAAQQQHSSQVLWNAASPYAPLLSASQHQPAQMSHAYAPLIWNDDLLHGGPRDVFSA